MTNRNKLLGGVALAIALFASGYLTRMRTAEVAIDKTTQTHDAKTTAVTDRRADAHVDATAGHVAVEERPRTVARRRRTTETTRDGTTRVTEEEEVEQTADRATTTDTAHVVADAHAVEHQAVTQIVHDQVIHEVRIPATLPRYLVGVQVGGSIPTLLGGAADRQLLPFLPRVVHGTVTVDVRLIGTVYGGVWASTTGAAGLSLRVGLGR